MATPKQAGRVSVQVTCLAGGRNFAKDMLVPVGQTLGWCVNASGIYGIHPDLREARLGVWGKLMKPETVVADGDRIEVYVASSPEAARKARLMKGSGIAKRLDLEDKQVR